MTAADVQAGAASVGANICLSNDKTVGLSMGEGITRDELFALPSEAFKVEAPDVTVDDSLTKIKSNYAPEGDFLKNTICRHHYSESRMLRYLKSLEHNDLSLKHSMISLGTIEIAPVTRPEFCDMHVYPARPGKRVSRND